MRLLLDQTTRSETLDEQAVTDRYPWPDDGPWVRAMMVTTLDGAAAGPDGLSGSISSTADQSVFNAVRRHADAVLIGASTLRAEEYSPMRAKEADAARRAEAGQEPAPVVAVVTRSLDLPWHLPIWEESTQRPIVVTSSDADPGRLATARQHADVITLPATTPEAVVDALVDRGLRRIVCEGGPHFLRDLIAADRLDEADITLSATFSGTTESPTTAMLATPKRFRLAQALEEGDFLMLRYLAEGR